MVREAPHAAGASTVDDLQVADSILLIGDHAGDTHRTACNALASRDGVTTRLRVCGDATPGATALGDHHLYRRSAGNHEGLDLGAAGLIATESISNLSVGQSRLAGFHLCIDGLAVPDDPMGQQTVFRFLYTITRVVSEYGVGCHVHLPVDASDEYATTVEPLFDTIVELGDDSRARILDWNGDASPWQPLSERPPE